MLQVLSKPAMLHRTATGESCAESSPTRGMSLMNAPTSVESHKPYMPVEAHPLYNLQKRCHGNTPHVCSRNLLH
jgi:hypothetical protein